MGAELPEIDRSRFRAGLEALVPAALPEGSWGRLHRHYLELRRWSRSVSLVGPGTFADVLQRHYAESLAALTLLADGPLRVVDVGTGAGFPGLVLAAARADLEVTLIEANQKKWSFLKSANRKMSLSCVCLNARVGAEPIEGLPLEIDVITSRAVSEPDLNLGILLPRLSVRGTVLLWVGESTPQIPKNFQLKRRIPLAGSRARRIAQIVRR